MSWPTIPLKRVASVRVSNVDKKAVDGDVPVRLCNYTNVYYRDVIHPGQEFMAATATRDQLAAFRLRAGDVVITKDSETPDDIGVPAYVAASAPDLVCGYHLAIVRPAKSVLNARYLYWAMSSAAVREQLTSVATGITRHGLRADSIGSLDLPLPGLRRQHSLATFLDAETARIDAVLVNRRQLLGTLAEREHVAIERRLHSMARGTVPLRRLLEKPPQYGANEPGDVGMRGWPRYIRITDLSSDGALRDDDVKRLPPDLAWPYLLRDGDLLFARSGATSGKAFRYRQSMGESCFAGYLIRFRIRRDRALPELIELWTQTAHYWGQIAESIVQATIQNVSAERYLGLAVPDVPQHLQTALVRELTELRRGTSSTRGLLERQIVLLEERRRALITAAVTGELEIPRTAA